MSLPPRILVALLAIVALGGLSACGDTTVDKVDAVDCAANPGNTTTVEIPEFAFEPTPIEVAACDQVVWKNAHNQAHTSTSNGEQSWSTGNIRPGDTSDPVLFDAAGTFTYMCALHPFMKGTVDVS